MSGKNSKEERTLKGVELRNTRPLAHSLHHTVDLGVKTRLHMGVESVRRGVQIMLRLHACGAGIAKSQGFDDRVILVKQRPISHKTFASLLKAAAVAPRVRATQLSDAGIQRGNHLGNLYQRANEIILFWDAKLIHSGSNSGTPWHLKKDYLMRSLVLLVNCPLCVCFATTSLPQWRWVEIQHQIGREPASAQLEFGQQPSSRRLNRGLSVPVKQCVCRLGSDFSQWGRDNEYLSWC